MKRESSIRRQIRMDAQGRHFPPGKGSKPKETMAKATKAASKRALDRRIAKELRHSSSPLVPIGRNLTDALRSLMDKKAADFPAFDHYRVQFNMGDNVTVGEVLAARTVTLALMGKSDSAMRQVWERIEGKVPESVDMNHRGVLGIAGMNLAAMTDDQLERCRSVLDRGGDVLEAVKEARKLRGPKLLEDKAG